jgi:multiple sugar transport system permease protein
LEGVKPSAYTWKILVPLSLPPLITASMVAFLGAWNGFTAPLLFINSERLYPVSLRLFSWVGSLGSGAPLWNLFAAASLVNTAIIALLFIRFKNPMKTTPLGDDRA